MMRITIEGLALFLLPFAVYLAVILIGPRLGLPERGLFASRTIGLAACGIGLVILGLVTLGVFADRAKGTYVPAHLDNGRLVPGRLQ